MRNGAYTLATGAAVLGLVLLMLAEPGAGLYTSLGTVILGVAVLLAGLGKGIDLLGYVHEGATDADDGETAASDRPHGR
jgi:hypothetical protein